MWILSLLNEKKSARIYLDNGGGYMKLWAVVVSIVGLAELVVLIYLFHSDRNEKISAREICCGAARRQGK